MAMVMPPTVLVPVHTVVQLGSGVSRTIIMWRHVMKRDLPPFIVGAILGRLRWREDLRGAPDEVAARRSSAASSCS